MRSLLAALALLFLPAIANAQDFAPGQVWEYETREQDEGSLLRIHAIEMIGPEDAPITVYHIAISEIWIEGRGETVPLNHTPISQEALEASVIRLSDRPFPELATEEGLADWRRNEGGVFTIEVAEIAAIIDRTVSANAPRPLPHAQEQSATGHRSRP